MGMTVRCPYCISDHEFRPMVTHVDGRCICSQCGHISRPGDKTYECHCPRCMKLTVSSTLVTH